MYMRSEVDHQHTLKLPHKCQQHENHVQRQKVYIIIINVYGKENRREHCRSYAQLDFCKVVYD